jgi:Ser/Thr protein kinase RdoA (MazF antagonist)
MANNPIARPVSRFGVRARRIFKVQNGVYRITAQNGKRFAFKRMPVYPVTLRWIDRSLFAVRKNGFTALGWRSRKSKEGKRLFVRLRRGGFPRILIPWISGRWPSIHSPRDMRACGVALARFHRAGRGSRRRGAGAVNKVGQWPAALSTQQRIMSNVMRSSKQLRKYRTAALGYAFEARRLLRRYGYHRICRTRRNMVTLCHGDGGSTNFIINARGVHFIDFETLRVDLRAYDLYRIIFNTCKDHGWPFAKIKPFLNGYQSVEKLGPSDFAMLHALLRFPQSTYLQLRTYRRVGARTKAQIAKGIPRSLGSERRVSAFLERLDRYSRRKGSD